MIYPSLVRLTLITGQPDQSSLESELISLPSPPPARPWDYNSRHPQGVRPPAPGAGNNTVAEQARTRGEHIQCQHTWRVDVNPVPVLTCHLQRSTGRRKISRQPQSMRARDQRSETREPKREGKKSSINNQHSEHESRVASESQKCTLLHRWCPFFLHPTNAHHPIRVRLPP